MRKLKIGYLITYFYPYKDGMENNCYSSAVEMAKLGHEVHIFTSDRRDNIILKKKYEIHKGIHIHRSKTILRYRHYLDFSPNIVLNVLKANLDILHVHAFGFPLYDLTILIKKFLEPKLKILNTPHGPFMALTSYPFWQKALGNLYAGIEYPINRIYDAVIQVNDRQSSWMIRDGVRKKRIKYVPNTIPKSMFIKVSNKDFVKKYKLKNKIVIGNIGRVMEYKGQHHIIQALPGIIKKYPNVVFFSMGRDKDNWIEYCKKLAKELGVEKHVIFRGEYPDEEKPIALDAVDIFAHPSNWEAFGIVTLEAMARGCPIVSTDTEGSLFLVKKENGFIHKWNDVKQLQKYLLKLIEDKKLRKQMSKTNKEKALTFENSYVAKNYLEPIYRELTK